MKPQTFHQSRIFHCRRPMYRYPRRFIDNREMFIFKSNVQVHVDRCSIFGYGFIRLIHNHSLSVSKDMAGFLHQFSVNFYQSIPYPTGNPGTGNVAGKTGLEKTVQPFRYAALKLKGMFHEVRLTFDRLYNITAAVRKRTVLINCEVEITLKRNPRSKSPLKNSIPKRNAL